MTRYLVAVVLAVGLSGCAVDTEDPLPGPEAQEPQRDPPAQALSGQLQFPGQTGGDVVEPASGPRQTIKTPIPSLNVQPQK